MLKVYLDKGYYKLTGTKYPEGDAWVGDSNNAESIKWIAPSGYSAVVSFSSSTCKGLNSPHGDDRFIAHPEKSNKSEFPMSQSVIDHVRNSVQSCEFEFCYILIKNNFSDIWISCCGKSIVQKVCPGRMETETADQSLGVALLDSVDVIYAQVGQSQDLEVHEALMEDDEPGILESIVGLITDRNATIGSNLPNLAVFKRSITVARPKLIVRR